MALVGRSDDLAYLDNKMRNSPRKLTRDLAKQKIAQIMSEDKSPTIAHLRHRLIQAERADNAAEAEKIRQAIRRESA